ncbi:TVP38/TMEM64 family protein [Micromonospora sp. DT229]|uniref:TVP38/TMEM64 family protein n=1 Tax=Micromonospora sp. DT229 TaxID=3393430 RepID=UPI003CE8B207
MIPAVRRLLARRSRAPGTTPDDTTPDGGADRLGGGPVLGGQPGRRGFGLVGASSGLRFGLLVFLLAGFGLFLLLTPLPDPATLPHLADRLGGFAPVAAILGGALLLVALVPRTFITLAAGAIFGMLPGALYTLGAALVAAAAGFAVGRLLGRDFVAERVRGRLARLDRWFTRQSVVGVITVRLLPISAFGLVSYGYGTTGARMLPFLTGSVLASVPTAFGYAALGAAVTSPDGINWYAAAPASLGFIASAILVARWWRAERRTRAALPLK